MAKFGGLLGALLLLIIASTSQLEAAADEDRFALSIIHINDFHARQVQLKAKCHLDGLCHV